MKVCFVADNRTRENWGCRATSISLKKIIAEKNEIVSTIYGDITLDFNPSLYKSFNYFNRIESKFNFIKKNDRANFISIDTEKSIRKFNNVVNYYKPLKVLLQKIDCCDAVVVNGEGTFIFSTPERYDTKFYLFILALAQEKGKKTYCLNSMFSDGTGSVRNELMLKEARKILERCEKVQARDPLSYDYYKKNIGENIEYVPDALFSWFMSYRTLYRDVVKDYPLVGIPFPEMDEMWNDYNFKSDYICVSGSSYAAKEPKKAIVSYIKLIEKLKTLENVIVVATCSGDMFLKSVAEKCGVPFVHVESNILYGYSLLANAKVFVSGRWHPSILAYVGGTPCVMMNSNSHKTVALQEMLELERVVEYDSIPSENDISHIVEDVKMYLCSDFNRDALMEKFSNYIYQKIILE